MAAYSIMKLSKRNTQPLRRPWPLVNSPKEPSSASSAELADRIVVGNRATNFKAIRFDYNSIACWQCHVVEAHRSDVDPKQLNRDRHTRV
jgi:hypothetical protein